MNETRKPTAIEAIEMMTQKRAHFVGVWRDGSGWIANLDSEENGFSPVASGTGANPEAALIACYDDWIQSDGIPVSVRPMAKGRK